MRPRTMALSVARAEKLFKKRKASPDTKLSVKDFLKKKLTRKKK